MNSLDTKPSANLHYYDRDFGIAAVKLMPGQCYVTTSDILLTTVLGSCVSACLRDSTAGVGGMNHFMLPEDADDTPHSPSTSMRYGIHAMAMLMSELLKAGARRDRLEAKVFGGGAVMNTLSKINIGERNADFVLRFLQAEQIPVVAQDLRGALPRRINYFPMSGRVALRKLRRQEDTLLLRHDEQALAPALARQPLTGKLVSLELSHHDNHGNPRAGTP
ncbi:MAG: chemoreceptor glutamine deamidase CheD [Rhodoferax sp.]|nr:chemoreceptor glutamine deamidase CheD [Rhodoferax sp.]